MDSMIDIKAHISKTHQQRLIVVVDLCGRGGVAGDAQLLGGRNNGGGHTALQAVSSGQVCAERQRRRFMFQRTGNGVSSGGYVLTEGEVEGMVLTEREMSQWKGGYVQRRGNGHGGGNGGNGGRYGGGNGGNGGVTVQQGGKWFKNGGGYGSSGGKWKQQSRKLQWLNGRFWRR
ncbi:glycine-rich RNA-binding protein 1-like [Penaeus monodon]|uniref:glycine-rich RNA-binding protein 1-like n=1 Tax=Penaeus monodon TaxID=6687 RepID=UPI0018A7B0E0|nr:glycine-rich RNA-binding protein 1-like [Penaeus monodon]